MSFPGGVSVVYSKKLNGTIVVGIEGVLRAASRYCGLRFNNTNATYGEEMPDAVKGFIVKAVDTRYAPIASEALAARGAGTENWRELRDQAFDILAEIANEAEAMWHRHIHS